MLIIAGRAGDGTCGVSDHSLFLAIALSQHIQVSLLCREGMGPRDEYKKILDSSNVHLVPIKSFGINNFKGVLATINQIKPDIIHLQYPAREFRLSAFPLSLALEKRRLGKSLLGLTLHEYAVSHPLRKLYSSLLMRASDFIIVPSWRSFSVLRNGYAQRVFHIPDGAFFHLVLESLSIGKGSFKRRNRLLYFGFPSKTKRLGELIKIVRNLRNHKKLSQITLGIVSQSYYESSAKNLSSSLSQFVEFFPFQDVVSLYKLAQESLLVIFPFSFDTHRSSLINALSFNMPIYYFGVEEGLEEHFKDGLCFYSEKGDMEQNELILRELIVNLLQNYEETSRRILQAQSKLLESLNISKIANAHALLYNNLLRSEST